MIFMYSKEIAESIERFLSERIDKDRYDFNAEKGVFSYYFIPNCKIKSMYSMIFVEETSFSVVSSLELVIPYDREETILKYLTEINQYTDSTKFVLDLETKEIYCECCTNCKDVVLTDDIISHSLRDGLYLVKIFGDFLCDISEGREIDEEEFKTCLLNLC